MDKKVYQVGIIGCGNISEVYVRNLQQKYKNTKVVALCNRTREKAVVLAEKYQVEKVLDKEEMFIDESIDVILILTTPESHYELTKQALLAGKHVYVEKPIAFEVEEGEELVELAKEKGVLLGCAPDTYMGEVFTTAKQMIVDGKIGEIISTEAFDLCRGHESWHENPDFFYQKGGGPMLDRGPYFLATLLYLCGNITSVSGMAHRAFETRTITSLPRAGEKITVEVDTHISAMYRYENGAVGMIQTSFDICKTDTPAIEIHGTKGSLKLSTPIDFWGKLEYCDGPDGNWVTVVEDTDTSTMNNLRGMGLSQMLDCIESEDAVLASGKNATLVLEIMNAMFVSSDMKKEVSIKG
ncbi:MAG: Gfo/Idh/MocA family oxidoreductase [Eubacteriales bacterium]